VAVHGEWIIFVASRPPSVHLPQARELDQLPPPHGERLTGRGLQVRLDEHAPQEVPVQGRGGGRMVDMLILEPHSGSRLLAVWKLVPTYTRGPASRLGISSAWCPFNKQASKSFNKHIIK
jgi:hypothetical protein